MENIHDDEDNIGAAQEQIKWNNNEIGIFSMNKCLRLRIICIYIFILYLWYIEADCMLKMLLQAYKVLCTVPLFY